MSVQVDFWYSVLYFVIFTYNGFCEPFHLAYHNPVGCALGAFMSLLPTIIMSFSMRWYALFLLSVDLFHLQVYAMYHYTI